MKKATVFLGIFLLLTLSMLSAGGGGENTIKIGFNIPLTGYSPKVGEGSKYAVELIKAKSTPRAALMSKGKNTFWTLFMWIMNSRRSPRFRRPSD